MRFVSVINKLETLILINVKKKHYWLHYLHINIVDSVILKLKYPIWAAPDSLHVISICVMFAELKFQLVSFSPRLTWLTAPINPQVFSINTRCYLMQVIIRNHLRKSNKLRILQRERVVVKRQIILSEACELFLGNLVWLLNRLRIQARQNYKAINLCCCARLVYAVFASYAFSKESLSLLHGL